MRPAHLLPVAAAAATALVLPVSRAGAVTRTYPVGSIVYASAGNIWVSSPDGVTKREVTTNGGWSSPSQSDTGVIVAQKNGNFYRMNRSGVLLGPAVTPIGSGRPTGPGLNFYGPYDPRVSPDGKRIAYWFRAQSSTGGTIFDFTATTASDHFDTSSARSTVDQVSPHWINNSRVVTTDPYGTGRDAISTWVTTGGDDHRQGWFYVSNVLAKDGELSPNGKRFAISIASDGASSPYSLMSFWSTTGPAWTAPGPYTGGETPPSVPTYGCGIRVGADAISPSWSPDSLHISFSSAAGVYVVDLPNFTAPNPCSHFRLLAAGATSPDWGPAPVSAP